MAFFATIETERITTIAYNGTVEFDGGSYGVFASRGGTPLDVGIIVDKRAHEEGVIPLVGFFVDQSFHDFFSDSQSAFIRRARDRVGFAFFDFD